MNAIAIQFSGCDNPHGIVAARGRVIAVFLTEPNRTQFDLNFRLGDIPVRIHPFFWIMAIVLGWNALEDGWQFLALWVGCVFVSILVHELGHVLMGRAFGNHGYIILYSFGGLATGSAGLRGRWQRVAVYFAGPLAGFILFGVVLVLTAVYAPARYTALVDDILGLVGMGRGEGFIEFRPTLVGAAIHDLFWINLMWGLVNLLPVLPLDGGQISREVCEAAVPRRGLRLALVISVVTAAAVAAYALATVLLQHPPLQHLYLGGKYTAIFFGLLAASCFMQLRQLSQQAPRRAWERDEEERAPWERDPDYWKKGSDPWNE
jgi:Zn-dependent protease